MNAPKGTRPAVPVRFCSVAWIRIRRGSGRRTRRPRQGPSALLPPVTSRRTLWLVSALEWDDNATPALHRGSCFVARLRPPNVRQLHQKNVRRPFALCHQARAPPPVRSRRRTSAKTSCPARDRTPSMIGLHPDGAVDTSACEPSFQRVFRLPCRRSPLRCAKCRLSPSPSAVVCNHRLQPCLCLP